ncbi:hypothetical protein BBP40_010253, partial [Aspergillus hancockii]
MDRLQLHKRLPGDYNYYHYTPSKVVGIIAIALYGSSAANHIFQARGTRAYFFASFITGAVMMTLGYVFRVLGSEDPTSIGPYVAQAVCIVRPPAFYAATIYMTYGLIVHHVHREELSAIAPNKVTNIFLIGDIVAVL